MNPKFDAMRQHAKNCPKCRPIYDTIGILTGLIQQHQFMEEGK